MVYLFTAMYCEAAPFIQRYRLKKNISQTRFQMFENEEAGMRLVITGSGMTAACAALSAICAACGVTGHDFCLNVGVCAGMARAGRAFLCNKITDNTTGRTFYPDILYRHPFEETRIISGAVPFGEEEVNGGEENCLYDMEAAALYQAGSYFFSPHQMGFVKIVSDAGNGKGVTSERIEELVSENLDAACGYLELLRAAREERRELSDGALEAAEEICETLCRDMHCTRAMSDSLAQHIRYCALAGSDYQAVVRQMYGKGLLPCKDKREGKICFEEFKRRLL